MSRFLIKRSSEDQARIERERKIHDQTTEIIQLRESVHEMQELLGRVWKELTPTQKELWPANLIAALQPVKAKKSRHIAG